MNGRGHGPFKILSWNFPGETEGNIKIPVRIFGFLTEI
jgi:hypothetical protein